MDDVIIIDNALEEDLFVELYNIITSPYQNWNLQRTNNKEEHLSFGYIYEISSDKNIDRAINNIGRYCNKTIDDILRVRFGLQLSIYNQSKINAAHIDRNDLHIVALLYMNDSDGDTYFYDNKGLKNDSITPKRNRLILFNGDKYHSSSTPVSNKYRYIINFNFRGQLK